MSLENKGGGGTQKWVENTMAGEGGAVNTAPSTPHISEEQAPAHGLHNTRGSICSQYSRASRISYSKGSKVA